MTASEQARAAAEDPRVWGRQGEDAEDAARRGADAASNVWKPLLELALGALVTTRTNLMDQGGWVRYDDAQVVKAAVDTITDALGR